MKKTVVVLILCVSLLTVGCAGVLTKAETPAQKIAYVETSYFALVKSIADAVQIGEITQAQYEASVQGYRMATQANLTLTDFVTPRQAMTVSEGVARIHITGALTDQAPPIHEITGGTDYRTIRAEIREAQAQGVNEIVYMINSGGGSIQGMQEAAFDIEHSGIPSTAYVDGMAASAAYYLATSASEGIVSSPSSMSGNIGAIMSWMDATNALTGQGVQSIAITNDGADLKSIGKGELTETQTQFLQGMVDEMGQDFRAQVERTRPNIDAEVYRAGWYQGEKALALGLIDQVGVLS